MAIPLGRLGLFLCVAARLAGSPAALLLCCSEAPLNSAQVAAKARPTKAAKQNRKQSAALLKSLWQLAGKPGGVLEGDGWP